MNMFTAALVVNFLVFLVMTPHHEVVRHNIRGRIV